MSATGTEVVTLEQLKMLGDTLGGGAGGKKYKIETSEDFSTQVQSSASAGDVVITAAGGDAVYYHVYELTEDGSSEKIISDSSQTVSIDNLPQVVQDALANMSQTMAVPPPASNGYSWFIMPPCDVYLQRS